MSRRPDIIVDGRGSGWSRTAAEVVRATAGPRSFEQWLAEKRQREAKERAHLQAFVVSADESDGMLVEAEVEHGWSCFRVRVSW